MRCRVLIFVFCFLWFAGQVYGESSFDREMVVKDKSRATEVENVFRDLLRAYENEDAREFLDYVSEDRFRQDYLTFTDALYSDFRTYEIYRVDYWVDRVVPDNVKQFLYVRWEKRYETLDDARQLNERGFSRFVFDEVNGEYLLIELAGNDLFGSSLAEWTEETPSIPGQEAPPADNSGNNPIPIPIPTPAKADLVIQSTGYVSAFGSISMLNFEIFIANDGMGPSLPAQVNVIDYNGKLDQVNIPAIPAGGTYSFVNNGPYEAVSGGNFIISVTIDPNNNVPETNESNNVGGPYFL